MEENLTTEQIERALSDWRREADQLRKKVEIARQRLQTVEQYIDAYEVVKQSLSELHTDEPQYELLSTEPQSKPAPLMFDQAVPVWKLMAYYLSNHDGTAKIIDIREWLKEQGRLSGKTTVAYTQVYNNARRKDDTFDIAANGRINLIDVTTDWAKEVGAAA